MPVSVGLAGPGELTVLPEGDLGAELARALSAPGEGAGDAGSEGGSGGARASDGLVLVEDLVGGLYPLLLAEYARCLGRCSPAADGAALRTLGRAVADLRAVREEGSLLRAAGGSTGGR